MNYNNYLQLAINQLAEYCSANHITNYFGVEVNKEYDYIMNNKSFSIFAHCFSEQAFAFVVSNSFGDTVCEGMGNIDLITNKQIQNEY